MVGMRYAPSSFRHNARIGAVLLPTLVVMVGFGGKLPVGVFLAGAMVAYIMDALRYREGALGTIWITLGLVNLSMLISEASFGGPGPLILSAAVSLCSGSTLFLIGVWATIQFKWVQLQYPVVCLALEKLLVSATFPAAAMVLSWGAFAAVGAEAAPFYLAAILAGLYCLLALPLEASFGPGSNGARRRTVDRKGSVMGEEGRIQSPLEGLAAAALTVGLPPLMYAVAHRHVLLESMQHVWSLLLLASAPLLFLTCLQEGLWWLPLDVPHRNAVRKLLLLVALGAALGGLEGRVVFRAFGQYIWLQPPWSYVLVTLALYGSAALAILHFAGLLGSHAHNSFLSTVGASMVVLCACAGAFAAGIPVALMPAPLVAASGLVLWYESGQLRDYVIFAAGALATAAWFVGHHFWFLEVNLAHHSLQFVCKLLMAAIASAALLPGLVYSKAPPGATSMLLLVQAVVVATMEENLFAGVHEDGSDDMYPAVFVVLTSALGLALTRKLHAGERVGVAASWFVQCIYVAKLSMLAIPEARLMVPVLLVTLAVTPPFLLRPMPAGGTLAPQDVRRDRTPVWQGLVQAAGVALAVLHARYALFEILQRAIGGRPTEAVLLGCLLLGVAAGCAPIVGFQYSESIRGRRWVAFLVAAGALLVMLRPPLPTKGGVGCPSLPFGFCPRLWDEGHIPGVEEDDAAIYSEALARRRHWPLWLIVGAVLAGLSAAGSGQHSMRNVAGQVAFAGVSGACVGAYLMWEFFPGEPPLQVLVFTATMLAASFLALLQRPLRGAAGLLPWLASAWALLLPLASFLQSVLALPPPPSDALRLHSDPSTQLDLERAANQRAALLAVWAAQALLLAFALKLKVSAAAANDGPAPARLGSFQMGGAAAERAAGFLGACMPPGVFPVAPRLGGSGGAVLNRLAAEGLAWAPTAGNLAALLCLALCLALNSSLVQGADEAIFVLAPILLLLSQDPLLFRGLTERRRYLPPVLCASAYLTVAAVSTALAKYNAAAERSPFVVDDAKFGTWFLAKNLGLLVATLPNHASFLQYLWSRSGASPFALVALSPLAALAALATDIGAVRLLAGGAIAAAAVQFGLMRTLRRQGMKLI